MTTERSTIDSGSSYDLIVLGAGAAGSIVADEAVARGARVVMIEPWKVGGTCLNAGCDPTKTLVKTAQVLHDMRHADRFGLAPVSPEVSWPRVMARVNEVIETIRGGDGDRNIRDKGIDLIKAPARFLDADRVEAGGRVLAAERILIATGATTTVPPIAGLREAGYIDNVTALDLEELPPSLAIIGGGVIAAEFAQIFARFGVEVTVIGSRDELLPKEEPELSRAIADVLREEGVRLELGKKADAVTLVDGRKRLTGEGVDITVDEILLAAGRKPNIEALELDRAGVAHSERGVSVNAYLQTSVPQIWAVGDVTGIYPFTHVADYQARIVAHNLFTDGPYRKADYRVIPWATFTSPELARVGLTEAEARAAGYSVATAITPMRDLSRAIVANTREGLVKLVVDRESRQVLGGHVLADHGGELIAEIALAMRQNLPVDAIADTVHTYPTLSESVFWTAYDLVKDL